MSERVDWLQRVCKWRTIFAGWQLGTRAKCDPECAAVVDHRECTILHRVELSALVCLLIDKGILTRHEWTEAVQSESKYLCEQFELRFPGMRSVDNGMEFFDLDKVKQTMQGWRP